MKIIVFIFFLLGAIATQAQKTTAFQVFSANGKKVSVEKMIKNTSTQDIILFGELHNDPIAHWLQYELTQSLRQKRELILAAEMFEADNQEALNKYLNDEINDKELDSLARLWKNFKTDYRPLVTIAKENHYPFIAANIPRKYASLVYKNGFEALDTLPEIEKQWIAPLPIAYDPELPCYRDILKMSHGHGGENLPKAQAIKDATMAYFILKAYEPGKLLIHYNGSYHSDNYQGILWYLKNSKPDLKYITISTVLQKDPNKLEETNKNLADFIIVVDEDMTNTY